MKILAIAALATLVCAPAFAQVTANQVVPGAVTVTGCAGSAAACFVPNTGLNVARLQSGASTNSTLVQTGAVTAFNIIVGNNGAAPAYLKLYNKATAPTCGTDTPVATLLVPTGGQVSVPGSFGVPFSLGLGYCITGGAADSDTTAVTANQVTGLIGWR